MCDHVFVYVDYVFAYCLIILFVYVDHILFVYLDNVNFPSKNIGILTCATTVFLNRELDTVGGCGASGGGVEMMQCANVQTNASCLSCMILLNPNIRAQMPIKRIG
jgi:hypothetical protein